MENKENHHGGFQQQSTQRLEDGYRHTNSQNDRWLIRLKLMQEEYYSIEIKKVTVVNMMYNRTSLVFCSTSIF